MIAETETRDTLELPDICPQESFEHLIEYYRRNRKLNQFGHDPVWHYHYELVPRNPPYISVLQEMG